MSLKPRIVFALLKIIDIAPTVQGKRTRFYFRKGYKECMLSGWLTETCKDTCMWL